MPRLYQCFRCLRKFLSTASDGLLGWAVPVRGCAAASIPLCHVKQFITSQVHRFYDQLAYLILLLILAIHSFLQKNLEMYYSFSHHQGTHLGKDNVYSEDLKSFCNLSYLCNFSSFFKRELKLLRFYIFVFSYQILLFLSRFVKLQLEQFYSFRITLFFWNNFILFARTSQLHSKRI